MVESVPAGVTSHVGRAGETRALTALLGSAALVTVTGPGGVGKTRLASTVAARARFTDGVAFVELGELREAELLAPTVAERLGLGSQTTRPPVEVLTHHLRTRRLLLVLDNCEHLVDACAHLVEALLRACPRLAVLATSRQSLGVAGERLFPVSPLAVPEPGESAAALGQYDAVRLLVDRATAVVPGFAVTADNAEDVIRLCAALDGLPLAIELAAIRLRSLSVAQVADRLADRFTLLDRVRPWGPGRHSGVRALIDWSHELCDDGERLLWARASVFSGPFDLDAAEEVCADADVPAGGGGLPRAAVLDALAGLVDKSVLLRTERRGRVRHRMPEMVRRHGEQRLRELGGEAATRRRHRDRLAALTEGFAAHWFGPDQVDWIRRVRHQHADLRRALDFCAHDPAEAVVGLRMVTAAKEYWMAHGLTTEGRMWLGRLLDAAPPDAPGRAHALWLAAFLALVQGDRAGYATALDQIPDTADGHARAYTSHVRGYAALMDGDGAAAAGLFGAAADTLGALGDRGGQVWATYNLGLALCHAGNLPRGREVLAAAVATCTEVGEVCWLAWALWSRSAAEYLFGDRAEAEAAGLEVMRLQRRVDARTVVTFTLATLAGCAAHRGAPRRSARLLGAAAAAARTLGASLANYAAFGSPVSRDSSLVVDAIGAAAAAEEFRAGLAMDTDAAVAYALGEERAPADPGLTAREAEVAALVAEGLTDREIAERLGIAPRTAETHVAHVRAKLGVRGRAQIAAWVAGRVK
ncbi:putative protein kinase [Actinokineospora spheciospongiae]|uniref:HTH luxR-type domain-containing protein n=1 Tax=Actinokineospora spheciospongiae TaxID=909613 RepID=W7IP95_9PSEU|nr:LuxR C-terminal-related transcriptional regulator [Actinokineospora spheciospongiae]EWC62213.1 putative protein kinase [Actinokineospora spheciospongiae]